MSSLFVSARETIDLGSEVIKIIGVLKEQDEALVHELALAITRNQPSAELIAALTEEQLELANRFFGKLADEVDLPDYFQSLLAPVGALDASDPLQWSWTKSTNTPFATSGSLTLDLSGNALAGVKVLPGPTYEFIGKAGIAGSARMPFKFGSLGMAADASGQCTLRCVFNHPGNTQLYKAITEDLGLVSELNDPTRLQAPFKSATLELTGQLRLSAEVSVGKSYLINHNGSEISAEANIGVDYGVDWAKSGRYKIMVTRKASEVRVQVEEMHRHESTRTLSIGAELKLNNVKRTVEPLMSKISALPAPLENLVKKYSQPGELLKKKLKEALSSEDPAVMELAEAMTGEREAKTFVNDLIETIVEEFEARAERQGDALEGDVNDLVEKIKGGAVFVDEATRSRYGELAKEKLTESIDGIASEMNEALKKLLEKHEESATSKLAEFFDGSEALFSSFDKRAKQLQEPLKKLIARYRELEESMTDVIEAIEKEKLSLAYSRSLSKTDNQELLIDISIREIDSRTAKYYRQMLAGDFSEALEAALNPQDTRIALKQCVFSRVFSRAETTGVAINLFGLGEVGAQRSLLSSFEVKAEGGELVVGTGSGNATGASAWFGEKLSMKLSSLVCVAGVSQPGTEALQIYASYLDPKLKSKELRAHLMSFESAELIADGATDRALDAYGKTATGEVKIDSILSFTRPEMSGLATLGEEQIIEAALTAQLETLQNYTWSARHLKAIRKKFKSSSGLDAIFLAMRGKSGKQIAAALGHSGAGLMHRDLAQRVVIIDRVNDNCDSLVDYIGLWGQLANAPAPKVNDQGKVDEADFDRFNHLNRLMIESLEGWAKSAGVIGRFGAAELSPFALAFFKTLTILTGKNAHLIPVVSWKQERRTHRIAVI